jgi:hypothetical protein
VAMPISGTFPLSDRNLAASGIHCQWRHLVDDHRGGGRGW